MSAHKIARDSKFVVAFDESKCYVLSQGLRDVKLLGTGRQSDGLYFFDKNEGTLPSRDQPCFFSGLSKHLWHCRLGHPSDHVLKVLNKDLKFDNKNNVEVCEICQKAKQTREPFPLSEHKTSMLADLVHLDVWGPYRVTSKEGYKYFLTIVDDYTRAVWVYLIKAKTEVLDCVYAFFNLIKNQFKRTVKIFRSDNGTEFVNDKFNEFCITNGIIHQTSCAYTPQQNGIVERKHRHLLNVADPFCFRGDSFEVMV